METLEYRQPLNIWLLEQRRYEGSVVFLLTLFELALQLGVVVFLGIIAFRMKAFDKWGLLAAIPIGFIIVVGGGWEWLLLIVVFLAVAALFTNLRYDYKRSLGYAQQKGGARGWPNIVANGSIPVLAALAEFYMGSSMFSAVFVGAVATSTADTLATEVGLLSKVKPRNIISLKQKVQAGTSGGVTPLGVLMSLVGSTLIGVIAAILHIGESWALRFLLIGAISGFIGSIIDSTLGATIQALYRCTVCSMDTEDRRHHDVPTLRIKGMRIVDNNVVNLLSVAVGASLAVVLLQIT